MAKPISNFLLISSMYPPDATGGVATHVNYLSESLNGLKTSKLFNVHVLTGGTSRYNQMQFHKERLYIHKIPGYYPEGKEGDSLLFHSCGSIPYQKPISYCMDKLCTAHTLPDVLHVHDFVGAHIAALIKTVYGVPAILTVHKTPKEKDGLAYKRNPKDFHLKALIDLNIFDKFIAPSLAYKQQLLDSGVDENKIKIIYHGIPGEKLLRMSDNNIFEKLGIDPSKFIIFAPIRLDNHKAPDVFIDAAKIVLNETANKDLLFVIAGSGSIHYKEKLIKQSRELGISGKVIIGADDNKPLSMPEMASLYRASQICVVPSRREGFGLSVVEAFIFNRPVVTASTGGMVEVINPGENGLRFDRDEPEDLARQLLILIESEELRRTLGLGGHTDYNDKYSSTVMAKNYFQLYGEIGTRRAKAKKRTAKDKTKRPTD